MDVLQESFDASFDDGPPPPPIATYVEAGRRALKRRRRLTSMVVALSTFAVVVATWSAVSPGTNDDSDRIAGRPSVATSPGSPGATPDPAAIASVTPWAEGELVRYVSDRLEIRPGVIVHEHIRNPYHYEKPSLSDALDVTYDGRRSWLIIEKRPSPQGTSSSTSDPSNGWASFAAYVADQVDVSGDSGWPDTFILDARGRVVPTALTRVINRTDDPELGPDFAAPGETTGAAVVEVVGETGTYFVVWRVVEGDLDVITTPPTFTAGASFAELLARARAQYASGEGLR